MVIMSEDDKSLYYEFMKKKYGLKDYVKQIAIRGEKEIVVGYMVPCGFPTRWIATPFWYTGSLLKEFYTYKEWANHYSVERKGLYFEPKEYSDFMDLMRMYFAHKEAM